MVSSNSTISINIDEFIVLVDRSINKTPAGRGWGVFPNVHCPYCGYTRTERAHLGTRGITCPVCSNTDRRICFFDNGNFRKGDGAYLCPVGQEMVFDDVEGYDMPNTFKDP